MSRVAKMFQRLKREGRCGLIAYVIFKSCEHRLTDWLSHGK